MGTTYELNNLHKDADSFSGKFNEASPVSEIFSAMVGGKDLSRFGAKADKAVEYIKGLGSDAENGNPVAIAELNTLRRFAVESSIMEEVKMLSIFGSYTSVGFDETVEREVYRHVGEHAREQAPGGDVVYPTIVKDVYPVPTFTVSGGYALDYRRVANGDMSKENEGLNQVRVAIWNRAMQAVVNRVYKVVKDASGVKFAFEEAGLTKSAVDDALTKVRRFGKPTIIADYAILSQFTPWAGYSGQINSTTITGISDDIINEIARNGIPGMYNGAILSEMPNPYDIYAPETDKDGSPVFKTVLPAGLGFIVPTGTQSPIATFTRGGITSFTGNNVHSGLVETRFDLEMAVDVAKGQEYKIAMFYDTNIGGLS